MLVSYIVSVSSSETIVVYLRGKRDIKEEALKQASQRANSIKICEKISGLAFSIFTGE